MLNLLVLFGFFLQAGNLTVHLDSPREERFQAWTLRLDTSEVFTFDATGNLELAKPAGSLTFEIIDDQQQVRFLGVWRDYGQRTEIEIHINADSLNLNQVVSASRIRQDAFRAPAEVAVIRPRDNLERAALQTSDWLKEEAEVVLQKTNLGGGSPIMRGMSGNRILLMVDGFRINNSTFRLGLNQYLNTVPAGQLEQIEVLSGPTGVQYGSDGLGGTIHLRVSDPASTQPEWGYRGFVSTADGTHTHRLTGGGQIGDFHINGHFQFNEYENLEAADPVGEQKATGYGSWDGSFNATYKIDEDRRLRLINSHSHATHVPRTDRILSGRDLLWEYHPQKFALHGLRYESSAARSFADFMDFGVGVMQQDEGNLRIPSGSPDERRETYTATTTLQANGTLTKVTRNYQIIYGFDLAIDELDATGSELDLVSGTRVTTDGKFPADSGHDTFGAFLSVERTLPAGFSAKVGMRQSFVNLQGSLPEPIGFVDETYDQFTPSFTLSRKGDTYNLALIASQGFRAPSLEDALSLGPSNQGFDAPNPGLQPEEVWNYELNYRLRRGNGNFQASLYTSRFSSLMEKVRGSWLGQDTYQGEPVYILDNVGEAKVDGISLAYRHQLNRHHSISSDAAWVRGTQTTDDVPMRRIPPLRGNFVWRYDQQRFRLSSTFSWAKRQDRLSPGDLDDSRIPEGGTPGYGVFHLRGRYRFSDQISLNLGAENITDKLYKSHGSGIYEPGRRIVLALDARWN